MDSIGLREIRQNASAYLRRVRAGEMFQVTHRGRPVAVLVSNIDALRAGAGELIAGLVAAGAYPDAGTALAEGTEALVRQMRRELVDAAIVAGYTRVPQEGDAWMEEASAEALTDLESREPW